MTFDSSVSLGDVLNSNEDCPIAICQKTKKDKLVSVTIGISTRYYCKHCDAWFNKISNEIWEILRPERLVQMEESGTKTVKVTSTEFDAIQRMKAKKQSVRTKREKKKQEKIVTVSAEDNDNDDNSSAEPERPITPRQRAGVFKVDLRRAISGRN